MSHGVRPGCAVVHVEPGGAVVGVVVGGDVVVVVGGPLTPPRACGRTAHGFSTCSDWQRPNGPATGPHTERVSTSAVGPAPDPGPDPDPGLRRPTASRT